MNRKLLSRGTHLGILISLLVVPSVASATIPYGPLSGGIPGSLGPGLASPSAVPGKEYSHDIDFTTTGGGGIADPEQVIAWDGSGGTADGLDFSGTRPNYPDDDQVDALANHGDHLFPQVIGQNDTAHLIFSHDDQISVYGAAGGPFAPLTVPSAGPVTLSGGTVIGGAGELSYELASAFAPPSTQGVWAPQPAINGMPLPRDVDAVELWGPEPALSADSNKYSLEVDGFSGTSVWDLTTGSTYIPHGTIVSAVESLLGPVSGVLPYPDSFDGDAAVNLDALMVQDIIGSDSTFDRDPTGGPGDQIIFSIRQIVDPSDPDGYYATGSELFVLDATTGTLGTTYLFHGGHLWDHAYALSSLAISPDLVDGRAVIDINAIEAVSATVIPEPSSIVLLAMVGVGAAAFARRRGAVRLQ